MDEPFSIVCPACGASLHVAPNVQSLTCNHCGAQYLVKSSADSLQVELIREANCDATRDSQNTAAELAIRRLAEEIASTERQLESLRRERTAQLSARDRQLPKIANRRIIGVAFVVVGFVVAACSGVVLAPSTIRSASATGLSIGALFAAIGLALLISARPASRTGGSPRE